MSQVGFFIDLLITVGSNPSALEYQNVKKYVKNVFLVKRSLGFLSFLSIFPMQITSRKALGNFKIDCKQYDIVLLENEYVYMFLKKHGLMSNVKVCLRVHNNETSYFKELYLSCKVGLRKFYYLIESFKFGLLEKEIAKNIRNFMFISFEEFNDFINKYPHSNSIFLPPAIDIENFVMRKSLHTRTVLFIGSLFMINNIEAIQWYIKNVHGLLSDINGYELIIAGNSKGENLNWLSKLVSGWKNIRVFDSPSSLDFLYDQSVVFINPMLHGAGVKMKNIDAIKNGLPVVTSKVGNQGTGLQNGRDVMVAESPADFAEKINELLANQEKRQMLIDSAQKHLIRY